ncbi:Uncharacterised protein [Mycobacterium tuberculosis]|nr:Uncharacterised protein [Mycobacterium tuberculosis]
MIAGVAAKRMNREQFFRAASGLDEDRLRKALWNLYWRGTANMRERIEAELASAGRARPARKIKPPADPDIVGWEVDEFVSLARSGAYLGGDRRVSPRERSRWRFTFKRLAAEAQDALRAEDAEPAASALEQLIDLAREADGYDYFRSDDPVAAAGFVVSDVAAAGHPHFREFAAESVRRSRREYRPPGYYKPKAVRSRSASIPPRAPAPAGNVSRSLIRSARRVGSSAACRGVCPSSAGMG